MSYTAFAEHKFVNGRNTILCDSTWIAFLNHNLEIRRHPPQIQTQFKKLRSIFSSTLMIFDEIVDEFNCCFGGDLRVLD